MRKSYSRISMDVIAIFALIIWSGNALFLTALISLPKYQIIISLSGVSFLVSCISISYKSQWNIILNQSKQVWLCGILGIGVQYIAVIHAFANLPAAEAELIICLWPILTAILSWLFLGNKLLIKHFIAIMMSLCGVILMKSSSTKFVDIVIEDMNFMQMIGYIAALIAAISWAMYTIFCKSYKKEIPSEMIGFYSLVIVFIALTMHLQYEEFIWPDTKQMMTIICLGAGSNNIAYGLWCKGIKHGNSMLLLNFAYFVPIVSLFWLILFNVTQFDWVIIVAFTLVVISSIIISNKKFQQMFFVCTNIMYLLSYLKYKIFNEN